jgi:hypothetical protein
MSDEPQKPHILSNPIEKKFQVLEDLGFKRESPIGKGSYNSTVDGLKLEPNLLEPTQNHKNYPLGHRVMDGAIGQYMAGVQSAHDRRLELGMSKNDSLRIAGNQVNHLLKEAESYIN